MQMENFPWAKIVKYSAFNAIMWTFFSKKGKIDQHCYASKTQNMHCSQKAACYDLRQFSITDVLFPYNMIIFFSFSSFFLIYYLANVNSFVFPFIVFMMLLLKSFRFLFSSALEIFVLHLAVWHPMAAIFALLMTQISNKVT